MTGITRRDFVHGTALLAAGAALSLRPQPSLAAGGMRFDEYRRCDALELARLVRTGEVSPAELLELAIARTEQVNPGINAVVIKHYEAARAESPPPAFPMALFAVFRSCSRIWASAWPIPSPPTAHGFSVGRRPRLTMLMCARRVRPGW